jgi:hypothetical protein
MLRSSGLHLHSGVEDVGHGQSSAADPDEDHRHEDDFLRGATLQWPDDRFVSGANVMITFFRRFPAKNGAYLANQHRVTRP